jgi:hypothetical protein
MLKHKGYSSGHPWYYRLGGRILSASEIRDEARGEKGYLRDQIQKIDRLNEPKRSQAIIALRSNLERELREDLRVYIQVSRKLRYRRRWLGPYPDERRDIWDEPCTGMSLKHNHIWNGFANLDHLNRLREEQQLSLF